jgi:uncharacterized protein DUF3810
MKAHRTVKSGTRRVFRASLVAAAAAAAVLPLPPAAVQRWYTGPVYGTIQPLLTSASNLAPFALFDVLIGAVAAAWLLLAVRDLSTPLTRRRGALRIVVRTLVWSATCYLLFLATWGLNYRRPRLRDTLPYSASSVTPAAALAAGQLAVARLNALYEAAHAERQPPAGEIDAVLAAAFARASADAGITREVVPGRPKRSWLDAYFRAAGVDGMTDPFFLETLVAAGVLPIERPFVVAHEWSHLAGIADEGEANFAGWVACMRGSPAHAYSGWLFLYAEMARAVNGRDRAALSAALASGPRADLAAIRARYAREVNRRVSDAGWQVYDAYLKANRVEAGAASYDEVVRLVLGVRLDGRPALDISR